MKYHNHPPFHLLCTLKKGTINFERPQFWRADEEEDISHYSHWDVDIVVIANEQGWRQYADTQVIREDLLPYIREHHLHDGGKAYIGPAHQHMPPIVHNEKVDVDIDICPTIVTYPEDLLREQVKAIEHQTELNNPGKYSKLNPEKRPKPKQQTETPLELPPAALRYDWRNYSYTDGALYTKTMPDGTEVDEAGAAV